jgi:hypothetical protein
MSTEVIEAQAKWVVRRFGLSLDRARTLAGLAFQNGRAG